MLVKWNTECPIVSWSSTIDHKRQGNRETDSLHSLEDVPSVPWGATWGHQGRERQDIENMPLLGLVGEVLWGS